MVLQAAIDAGEVIPWHRARAFQDLTLRLILQRLLHKEAAARHGGAFSFSDTDSQLCWSFKACDRYRPPADY